MVVLFVKSLYLLPMGFSMSADPVLTLTASSKVDVCTVFPILPTKGLKLRAIRWRGQGHMTKNGQRQSRQQGKAMSHLRTVGDRNVDFATPKVELAF